MGCSWSALILFTKLVGILTDMIKDLLSVFVVFGPLAHVVRWLFVLKTLQNLLVFHCDFEQFSLPSFSIQTLFRTVESNSICANLRSGKLLL